MVSRLSIADLLKDLRLQLPRCGAQAAFDCVQTALRQTPCTPEEWDAVGRFLNRHVGELPSATPRWTLRWAGQCTTTWLMNVVSGMAWREGILVDASEAEFDNVFQDILQHTHASRTAPQIYLFVPWLQQADVTLLSTSEVEERFAQEIRFWETAWKQAETTGARVLQIGFDAIHTGPAGHQMGARSGLPALLRQLNEQLRGRLKHGAYWIDLPNIAGQMGRGAFYDPRRYVWTKQPFSELGSLALAESVVAGLRAMLFGPKKVLVLDLDNTLWGGVVGELGALHVGVGETAEGEAFTLFQKYLKALSQRGVTLAVASKNNFDDAREPFQVNPGMVLTLEDFAAFEASWQPKAESLRSIARTLNLGLDSFVFFDDNPAEREQVRQALPQVAVVDVPDEPAEYIRALESGLWFEALDITEEDRQRTRTFGAEQQRRTIQAQVTNLDDYLTSLNMEAKVALVTDAELPRVVQLLGKTNQFNLTTRRHSEDDVRRLLADDRAIGLTVRLCDRFGDYGLIAVLLAIPDDDASSLLIDTWLMSCRVIGRSVEEFTCQMLLEEARKKGYRQIVGRYIPTPKNGLVADLYPRLGFQPLPSDAVAGQRFGLPVDAVLVGKSFVRAA